MGRKQRDKGQRGEREARDKLKKLFDCHAERGRQHHGRDDAPDVLTDIPVVHWEVKRTEARRLQEAVAQAISDCGERVPVVLHKANRKDWLAIVRLDDLPELVERIFYSMYGEGT